MINYKKIIKDCPVILNGEEIKNLIYCLESGNEHSKQYWIRHLEGFGRIERDKL